MLIRGTNLSQKSLVYPDDWGQGGRGCFAAGGYARYQGFDTGDTSGMTYVTISTPSNSTNFGSLGVIRLWGCSGTSGRGRGLIAGGCTHTQYSGNAQTIHLGIRYITIATLTNASSFGNLSVARHKNQATSNGTRALFWGGASTWDGNFKDTITIDYVTIATTNNATNFGNIGTTQQVSGYGTDATGDGTHGMMKLSTGSYATDKYDYVTIDTPGNSSEFGGVGSVTGEGQFGTSNGSRAFWGGGYNGGDENHIDYLTWSTLSNATQYGTLRVNSYDIRAVDDGSKTVIGGHNHTRMETFSLDLAAGSAVISSLFGHLTGTNYEGGGSCSSQNSSSCKRERCATFAGD